MPDPAAPPAAARRARRTLRAAEAAAAAEDADRLVIGVGKEPGEDVHHPGGEPLRRRGQRGPVGHIRIVPRQLRVRGDDAEFLLTGEHLLPVGVPAVVERARVPVRPFLGRVVRGVRGAAAAGGERTGS